MKKGFTLIELLAVVIILGVIALIVVPMVNVSIKKNKEQIHRNQIKEIETSAEKWAYSNLDLLPEDGSSITITLLELKRAGLIPLNVKDIRDGSLLPNDLEIVITEKDNGYVFSADMESGTDINSEVNDNSPIIVLNGNPIDYIEIGSNYTELGARAKYNDTIIDDINIVIRDNDVEIPTLLTNVYKTYTIVYSASNIVNDVTYTSTVTRTIIIRDTTKPVIDIPLNTVLTLSELDSFNLMDNVTVTDNSGEVITPTITELNHSLGKQVVTYTACDTHNNCETKKRLINIEED